MNSLKKIWKSHSISRSTKIRIINSLVFSMTLYGCETWILNKSTQRKIESFELWVWRRLLGISWYERQTNISVLARIDNPDSLLNIIKRRKLSYFGHICRRDENNLEKTIMPGLVNGKRRRGRPRRMNCDDVKGWLSEPLHILTRKAQNRPNWRRLVKEVTRGRSRPEG